MTSPPPPPPNTAFARLEGPHLVDFHPKTVLVGFPGAGLVGSIAARHVAFDLDFILSPAVDFDTPAAIFDIDCAAAPDIQAFIYGASAESASKQGLPGTAGKQAAGGEYYHYGHNHPFHLNPPYRI